MFALRECDHVTRHVWTCCEGAQVTSREIQWIARLCCQNHLQSACGVRASLARRRISSLQVLILFVVVVVVVLSLKLKYTQTHHRQEVEVLSTLDHPNVIRFYEVIFSLSDQVPVSWTVSLTVFNVPCKSVFSCVLSLSRQLAFFFFFKKWHCVLSGHCATNRLRVRASWYQRQLFGSLQALAFPTLWHQGGRSVGWWLCLWSLCGKSIDGPQDHGASQRHGSVFCFISSYFILPCMPLTHMDSNVLFSSPIKVVWRRSLPRVITLWM